MKKEKRKELILLGSTGSIGTQALDVIKRSPDRFRITAMTCGHNVTRLMDQLEELQGIGMPELVVLGDKKDADTVRSNFDGIKTSFGEQGLIDAATYRGDVLVNALVGMRGLVPTYHAVRSGKTIALANKETLVAGGDLIMNTARENEVSILPIDSEHSAIFQCLEGNKNKTIRRILLTCSGGPFRGMNREALESVTPEMALRHPNWSMGKKITIDSATLMNKGFETIEAKWLFEVPMDKIEIVIHKESVMHSAVEFSDSSILAQLGDPDMRVPISVALGYPDRLDLGLKGLDIFGKGSQLTFEEPDRKTFKLLDIAVMADKEGGTYPACMNAANEVLVGAFLEKRIKFLDIERGIERALSEHDSVSSPDLESIIEADRNTRERVKQYISQKEALKN